MEQTLKGKMVAILATDGFEQAELLEPRKALEEAGATTKLISPQRGKIQGWNESKSEVQVSVLPARDGFGRLEMVACVFREVAPVSAAS